MRDALLGLYCAVCLFCVAGPGFGGLGNRIEPFVLGLPFTLFWIAAWVVLTFFALLAYHLTRPKER